MDVYKLHFPSEVQTTSAVSRVHQAVTESVTPVYTPFSWGSDYWPKASGSKNLEF